MKYCTQCGKPNPDEAAFCVNCGATFPVHWDPDKGYTGDSGDDATVLLSSVPESDSAGDDATVLLSSVPASNDAGDDVTVFLGSVPASNDAGDDATVLLSSVPESNDAGDDATVLLGSVPESNDAGDDATVLLSSVPASNDAGDDATILLGSVPESDSAGEDATVLLGGAPSMDGNGQDVYMPPMQQPNGTDAQGASTQHLFPGAEFVKKEAEGEPSVSKIEEMPADEGDAPPFIPPENKENQNGDKKKKKGKLITLLCVLAVVVIGAGIGIFISLQNHSSLTPLQEALNLGEKYLEELDYENAVMAFTEATEIDPKSTEAYMGLAQSYTGAQKYEEAEASYRQLLELDASNAEGYRELAELYIRLEKLEEAKTLLEQAVNATDDEELKHFYEETTPKAPSFSLQEGSYDQRQEVAILADKENHVIHYTIDGSEPTEESPIYQEPIILKNGRTTVKAISISSRGYVSDTASASYTINVERIKVEFEDPAIENAVRYTLGLGYGDLYNEDVEQIRELTIVGYDTVMPGESVLFDEDSYTFQSYGWEQSSTGNVETLSDLRYMPFLRRLHIAFQEDLDISGVASASRLEELSLIHVGIRDLSPVSGLTNLKKLCVGWNDISDISDLSGLTSLTSLGVWNNRITDISPVGNMKGLTYLDFSANRVSDISAVSSLENLSSLWMYQNQVTDFSALEGLSQLRVLMIRDNPISDKTSLQKVFPRLGRTDVDVIDRGGQAE